MIGNTPGLVRIVPARCEADAVRPFFSAEALRKKFRCRKKMKNEKT